MPNIYCPLTNGAIDYKTCVNCEEMLCEEEFVPNRKMQKRKKRKRNRDKEYGDAE